MSEGQWTADDVAQMFANPVCIGIGPFPQIVDENLWWKVQGEMLRREGTGRYLRRLRRALLDTFPTGVPAVESTRFAQDNAQRLGEIGLNAFLSELLSQLREELKDVPAEATNYVTGYQALRVQGPTH